MSQLPYRLNSVKQYELTLESLFAVLVIDCSLVWIRQTLVGLSNFLKVLLSPFLIVGIFVLCIVKMNKSYWMPLNSKLPISFLNISLSGIPGDAEDLIVVFRLDVSRFPPWFH